MVWNLLEIALPSQKYYINNKKKKENFSTVSVRHVCSDLCICTFIVKLSIIYSFFVFWFFFSFEGFG